jgi:hypothetical protein
VPGCCVTPGSCRHVQGSATAVSFVVYRICKLTAGIPAGAATDLVGSLCRSDSRTILGQSRSGFCCLFALFLAGVFTQRGGEASLDVV